MTVFCEVDRWFGVADVGVVGEHAVHANVSSEHGTVRRPSPDREISRSVIAACRLHRLARMGWEDENTTLMPCEQLHGLVTQSKGTRVHPHLCARDPHADDFLREEAPSIAGPPVVISRARAEGLAVVALATALGLGIAAVVAAPF